MSIPDWATTVSAVLALLTIIGVFARIIFLHVIRTYLHELKPNGGSSVKDKVNHINDKVDKLETRIDQIYFLIVTEGRSNGGN
jgi:hypothetical protein